jgi:hypothetical protein
MFYYSRNRSGEHPAGHLADYAGILQADAYSGYTRLYKADRRPGPIIEAGCWVHARRPFFVLADIEANARRKAQGRSASVLLAAGPGGGPAHRRAVRKSSVRSTAPVPNSAVLCARN